MLIPRTRKAKYNSSFHTTGSENIKFVTCTQTG